jgi:propionyl-CoA carboxylase alpha chain
MIRAINEYEITGLETTLGFCRFVMQHEAFRSGHFDTGFVEKYFKPATWPAAAEPDEERLAALLAVSLGNRKPSPSASGVAAGGTAGKWKKNRLA